ncbi:MAG: M48 family metallopeptidase [Synergistaceae bacterium]|nr:M48 family metallopeptidase [Synergistaceae bacterium]
MKIVRSNRKTFALQIKPREGLIVRVPFQATQEQVKKFINDHRGWIEKHLKVMEERQKEASSVEKLSMNEIRDLTGQALKLIPERVRHYAPLLGVTYGRITIRNQRSRWGSCSGRKNLNFNCLLVLTPPEVIDSVVVLELAHLKEMNHSERFYAEVLRVFPDYWKWQDWLKEHGKAIMARMLD